MNRQLEDWSSTAAREIDAWQDKRSLAPKSCVLEAVMDVVGAVAFGVVVFIALWLYLKITPNQSSAINDLVPDEGAWEAYRNQLATERGAQ